VAAALAAAVDTASSGKRLRRARGLLVCTACRSTVGPSGCFGGTAPRRRDARGRTASAVTREARDGSYAAEGEGVAAAAVVEAAAAEKAHLAAAAVTATPVCRGDGAVAGNECLTPSQQPATVHAELLDVTSPRRYNQWGFTRRL